MISVFFAYSHRDEDLRNELEVHLSGLKRQKVIEMWHDRRIGAGRDVDNQIDVNLERAGIILLLVSPYFIASDYCYNIEMKRAIERHEKGEARVIPVILHPCDWQGAPFGKLRATPPDGKPVSKFANQHEAFHLIVKDIRGAVEELLGARENDNTVHYSAIEAEPNHHDSKKIYEFLQWSRDNTPWTFRSTEAISSNTNITESTVEELCIRHPKIKRNEKKRQSWRLFN